MTDPLTMKPRVIQQPAFSVTVRSDDSPERVAGKMLGAFYDYLKNFGTLYEWRAPEIQKARDFENNVTQINAGFRVGIDAEGQVGKVCKTDFGEIDPLSKVEDPRNKKLLLLT